MKVLSTCGFSPSASPLPLSLSVPRALLCDYVRMRTLAYMRVCPCVWVRVCFPPVSPLTPADANPQQ